jgi:hypothetical protein
MRFDDGSPEQGPLPRRNRAGAEAVEIDGTSGSENLASERRVR